MSQSVISLIRKGLPADRGDEMCRDARDARTSMFRAAQLVGEAVQIANRTVGAALPRRSISAARSRFCSAAGSASGPPQLFLVYSAGNFIQCKPEAPFLQIGETKYGRPILDRGVELDTPLAEAVKIGFLSFDARWGRTSASPGRST